MKDNGRGDLSVISQPSRATHLNIGRFSLFLHLAALLAKRLDVLPVFRTLFDHGDRQLALNAGCVADLMATQPRRDCIN